MRQSTIDNPQLILLSINSPAMELIRQPKKSKLCGQCCIAMIANITTKESVELFKHPHGTRTRELKRVLNLKGFKTSDRLIRYNKTTISPHLAILKILFKGYKMAHWVVISEGLIYDPSQPKPYKLTKLKKKYEGNAYISSYLLVV